MAEANLKWYGLGLVHFDSGDIGDGRDFSAWCVRFPPDVTGSQLTDIVQQYLANNPGVRHNPADELVTAALQDAWPCWESE